MLIIYLEHLMQVCSKLLNFVILELSSGYCVIYRGTFKLTNAFP